MPLERGVPFDGWKATCFSTPIMQGQFEALSAHLPCSAIENVDIVTLTYKARSCELNIYQIVLASYREASSYLPQIEAI